MLQATHFCHNRLSSFCDISINLVSISQYRYNVCMEKCQRKVNSFAVSRSVYLMGLFDWKLVKEEKHDNAPSVLFFERDENVPYYQEMVEVEKETSPKLFPFWILIVPVAIAFALMTAYLIMYLVLRPNFESMKFFFIFFVPSMVLLLADTGLFYLRSRQLMKYLQNEKEIVENAEMKMQKIKEKYGK